MTRKHQNTQANQKQLYINNVSTLRQQCVQTWVHLAAASHGSFYGNNFSISSEAAALPHRNLCIFPALCLVGPVKLVQAFRSPFGDRWPWGNRAGSWCQPLSWPSERVQKSLPVEAGRILHESEGEGPMFQTNC